MNYLILFTFHFKLQDLHDCAYVLSTHLQDFIRISYFRLLFPPIMQPSQAHIQSAITFPTYYISLIGNIHNSLNVQCSFLVVHILIWQGVMWIVCTTLTEMSHSEGPTWYQPSQWEVQWEEPTMDFLWPMVFFSPKLKNLSRLTESFNEQIQYVVHKFFSFPSFLLFLQNKLYLNWVKMDRVKLTCPGCGVAIFWPVSNTGWDLDHGPPHTNSNRPVCHPYL